VISPASDVRRPPPPPRELGPLGQLRAGRLARRLPQLYVGLVLYGVTLACLIRAHLGNAPWDVLHQGIADHLGVSVGVVQIAVSLLVLLAWAPLREMPGLGTISNAVVIGLATNMGLALLHQPHALADRIALMVLGIAGNAVATAMYMGARLGPGSRDGLMTGLHRRTGRPIWMVRTSLEVCVVVLGLLLGGVFGVGTVLYAIAIGPLVQRLLPVFMVRLGPTPDARPSVTIDRSRSADLAGHGTGNE
jgi:uncharacterized membrane protein YczE